MTRVANENTEWLLDALRELCGLCELRVAEVSRSFHSFCFCFFVRAIDLNRI